MNQDKQSEASSAAWQYTKGLIISQMALTTVLINSGIITVEDVIKQLEDYINMFAECYPDSIESVEPIKMLKDGLLELYPKGSMSHETMITWIHDFVGNA